MASDDMKKTLKDLEKSLKKIKIHEKNLSKFSKDSDKLLTRSVFNSIMEKTDVEFPTDFLKRWIRGNRSLLKGWLLQLCLHRRRINDLFTSKIDDLTYSIDEAGTTIVNTYRKFRGSLKQ